MTTILDSTPTRPRPRTTFITLMAGSIVYPSVMISTIPSLIPTPLTTPSAATFSPVVAPDYANLASLGNARFCKPFVVLRPSTHHWVAITSPCGLDCIVPPPEIFYQCHPCLTFLFREGAKLHCFTHLLTHLPEEPGNQARKNLAKR